MRTDYLIKGCLIGLSIAAPVGPIGVLTIKRTLTEGRRSGFVTGLGAAFADATYGAVAGFGLTAVSSFMMTQAFFFKLIGGLFLLYLGIKSFLSKPATKEARVESKGLFNNFISTFFLTVSNPATIIFFFAIFAGQGIGTSETDYVSSLLLVVGVFMGSALWWFILSGIVHIFKAKVTLTRMIWINRISGLIIMSFGVWVLCGCMNT